MGKLDYKAAIVTGATSGMGRAIAILFAKEGAAVLASGRNRERGQGVVDEIRSFGGNAEFVAGDIARSALFLASSDSEWITGTALTIDGGIMTGV